MSSRRAARCASSLRYTTRRCSAATPAYTARGCASKFQRVVAAVRIEFDPPGEGDNLKDQEREELRSLERLGGAQARIEGHGDDGELWLYIPQKRLEAHMQKISWASSRHTPLMSR